MTGLLQIACKSQIIILQYHHQILLKLIAGLQTD